MAIITIITVVVLGYGFFLAVLALWVSYKLTVPPRQKQKKTPLDGGLVFSLSTLKSPGGYCLRGWIVAACGPSKGTIILCHNYRASKQKMLPWINFLSRAGYETVAFDFNGHGESDRVHTFANLITRTVIDLQSILTQLDRLPLANRSRVGLMGFSMGSAALLGYLASHAKRSCIHAVVIDSGPPNKLVWNSRVDMMLKPAFKRLPGIRLVHFAVGRLQRFGPFPEGIHSAPARLLRTDTPFFFIQGLKDNISTPDQSRWLYDHLIRAPKSYWPIAESHHMTNLHMRPEEYQQRVLAFLDRYLVEKEITDDYRNSKHAFNSSIQKKR
jgi:pimeloyl-ACP methyl ester carboxylesterase